MTVPQHGAREPMLERTARATLADMRRSLDGSPSPPYAPLSPQERTEAQEKAEPCAFCIGNHALPNGPGCPRIASFELGGDGNVKAATYWPGTAWATGRVNLLEDSFEKEAAEGTAGDGER